MLKGVLNSDFKFYLREWSERKRTSERIFITGRQSSEESGIRCLFKHESTTLGGFIRSIL